MNSLQRICALGCIVTGLGAMSLRAEEVPPKPAEAAPVVTPPAPAATAPAPAATPAPVAADVPDREKRRLERAATREKMLKEREQRMQPRALPNAGGVGEGGAFAGRPERADDRRAAMRAAAAAATPAAAIDAGVVGRSALTTAIHRMLGVDISEHAAVKISDLPLGPEKRLVTSVPVGGIDNPGGTGAGWKVELIFKLSDEQSKSLAVLREEYAAEQRKLEGEIVEQQRVLAEKAKQLRLAYEAKANSLMTGADKEAKEKIDAAMQEANNRRNALLKEVVPMYDLDDATQGLALMRTIREKTMPIAQEAEEKLIGLVPAESRTKIEEQTKSQAAARKQMQNRMEPRERKKGEGEAGEAPAVDPQQKALGNF